jgi:hypothetical protein
MTAAEKLDRLKKLRQEIQGSEAYVSEAVGSDRRAEQRHLNQLRRDYHALRQEPIDMPTTTGETAALIGSHAA